MHSRIILATALAFACAIGGCAKSATTYQLGKSATDAALATPPASLFERAR